MAKVHPSPFHHQCNTVAIMFQFVVVALLVTACGGQIRTVGGSEVKAFLDETGQLHWEGHTYFKKQGLVTKLADPEELQATSCESGLMTSASYGSAETNVTLAQTLVAGEVLVFFCNVAFRTEDFTGQFLLRCVAAGALEIEYHCGCAAGAVPRPQLHAKLRPVHRICSAPSKPSAADQASTTSGLVWSSGSLDDGAAEDRLCSELVPNALGAWKIRCFEGRLCAEFESCLSTWEPAPPARLLPRAPLREQGDSAQSADVLDLAVAALKRHKGYLPNGEAEKEEELRWQNSVSRRIKNWNATAAPRRLVAVALCLNPPQDNWWPDICRQTSDTPYSTVAGARGRGELMMQLKSPYGIFVSPINEDLYIADWENHRIQKWPQGEGPGQVQTVAGEAGQIGDANDLRLLFNPSGIVVSQEVGSGVCGEMFIADESNNRVLRWPPYSDNGFVVAGGPSGELDHPTGIWVTADLEIYIADRYHHRVVYYTRNKYRLEWRQNSAFFAGLKNQAPGSSLDALDRPAAVALNGNRDVFIADFGNARLVRWRHGETVGTYIGRCFSIVSIYINEDGIIFAACQTSHCIKRWEPDSSVATTGYKEGPVTGECAFFVQAPHLDDPGYLASLGRFFGPSGVFVDKYGNIYVSDTNNDRVVKRGRDPLTQWIVTNGAATGFKFEIKRVEFFQELSCAPPLSIKTNISADGVVMEPWKPICSQAGNNRCPINDAWFGRQFREAVSIRCVKFVVSYDMSQGSYDAAVRYWTGSYFRTVYNFGKIPTDTEVRLRYPRFDAAYWPCVKGQRSCTLTLIGDWQSDGDRIMLTDDKCEGGNGIGLQGFPKTGMSSDSVSGGTQYTIGDPAVADYITNDARDDQTYHICWCDRRLKNCELGTDFTIPVGFMTLEGPYDSSEQYGWRGSPLNLTQLLGVGLKSGDKLTVISGKCGPAATDVLGIPRQDGVYIAASAPSATGLDYNWGTDLVQTDPDIYKLCWCRTSSSSACTQLSDFQANAGQLSINGPLKKQQFRCTKGDPCHFDAVGVNFRIGDSILILVRCGQGPLLNGFPESAGLQPRSVTRSTSAGSIGSYGWGPEGIMPTVGMYYVCWCGVQFNPTEPEDFSVEVGFLTVAGPEEKPLVCALGADCTIDLTGVHMEITKRGMVVASSVLCGDDSGSPVPGFPGETEGVSYLAAAPFKTLTWGFVDQKRVVPAKYRACWCHVESNCTTLADFKVSLGEMTVIGPAEWTEKKYCGVGKDCIVDLQGLGLSRTDTMVLINGQCGSGTLAQAKGSQTILNVTSRSDTGGTHIWTCDPLFPNLCKMNFEGEYYVCWCSNNCNTIADYKMTVGKMLVSAPQQNQQRFCTSGAACYVKLDGFGLRDSDRIAIVKRRDVGPSCGTDSEVVQGIPNQGISITTQASTSSATFILGVDDNGTNVVNANGGTYRICWCPSRCNSARDYLYDAGDLTIWGPYGQHTYTCYNGKACVARDIAGLGLQNGDQIRASSTCRIMLLVGGLPQSGVSLPASNSGTEFTWGTRKLQAIVGRYRLCWCSMSHNVSDPSDYVVDMGQLVIGGPVAGQSHRCQAGYKCELDNIAGFGLQSGDFVVILFTCGSGNPIYRGWEEGDPWRAWPPFISDDVRCLDGVTNCRCTSEKCQANYKAETQGNDHFIFNADTGKYRMCWCDGKTGTCLTMQDFTVDIGLFTAVGPDASQEYYCVPGFTCTLHKLKGVSLEARDEYVLQKDPECVGGNVVAGVPNNGISEPATDGGRQITWRSEFAPTTYPDGSYTLCWCPVTVACTEPADFVTRAAKIQVLGPLPNQNYVCQLGAPCIIGGVDKVKGVGLQNKDHIIVVTNECGSAAVTAPNFPSMAMSAPAQDTGQEYTFDMLINAKTGRYRLCWCPFSRTIDPIFAVPFQCKDNNAHPILEDFTVDFGELFLPEVPKSGEVRECISGNQCIITDFTGSTGDSLVDGSKILVKMNTTAVTTDTEPHICATSSVTVEGFPDYGESNPATAGGTTFTWVQTNGDEAIEAIWAEGGTYIMCWKAGAEVGFYAYTLGFLRVLGPGNEEQEFTCTKSADCILDYIEGYGLADGDQYRVMQPCAGNLDEETARANNLFSVPVVHMTNGVVFWQAFMFQPAPALYKICWCHRGSPCTKPHDFKTTVGTITVSGPYAGQNRKCDRGQSCTVYGIEGENLAEGDQAQVLVECGVGPEVPGLYESENSQQPIVSASKEDTDTGARSQFIFHWFYATSSPGIYRTCWCQASECQNSVDRTLGMFDVEIGILTIQGPYNDEYIDEKAPLWDHQWDIVLNGVNLHVSPTAKLRIMKECPSRLEEDMFDGQEIFDKVERVGLPKEGETGADYYFKQQDMQSIIPAYWTIIDTEKNIEGWADKEYKLCWCRGAGKTESVTEFTNCDDVSNFALDIGVINVVCEKGSQPTDTGCELCPVGRFKEIDENVPCEACSQNTLWTTASEGTRLGSECYCKPGYYYSPITLSCTICDINYFCTGGNRTDNGQRRLCPENSGAWPVGDGDDECEAIYCTGKFPAESALDCSCKKGSESKGGRCVQCQREFVKGKKGNKSECVECDTLQQGSTTLELGQSVCTCDAGLYMVRGEGNVPLFCENCPKGFYCTNGSRYECPEGRNTEFTNTRSEDLCLCGPGHFSRVDVVANEKTCVECLAGSIFYKSKIGDFNCQERCPDNSLTTQGASGPENCRCSDGWKQSLNLTANPPEYRCEPDPDDDAKKPQTSIQLTAVYTLAVFIFYPPESGGLTTFPSKGAFQTNTDLAQTVGTALGFPDSSKLILTPLEPINVSTRPDRDEAVQMAGEQNALWVANSDRRLEDVATRRLEDVVTTPTTTTTTKLELLTLNGTIIVPVGIVIWQGSVKESVETKDDVTKIETDGKHITIRDRVKGTNAEAWEGLEHIYFDVRTGPMPTSAGPRAGTRIDFHWEHCDNNSAVPPATTFISVEASCKCAPGYQKFDLATSQVCAEADLRKRNVSEDDIEYELINYPKCVPCCALSGIGRYKDTTGDRPCSACNSVFPETAPVLGANSSFQCICFPGQYRDGTKEVCRPCPLGMYCDGGTIRFDCPENEWTKDTGQDDIQDCECDLGYFKPFTEEGALITDPPCIECDPGYYKTQVENGIGRCTERCSTHFGSRSTSKPAAKSKDECVCSEGSYLRNDPEEASGKTCAPCPPEGVTCSGWKKNQSTDVPPYWIFDHSPPEANLGFFMLDRRYAVVEACRIQTAAEGSVCRGKGECAEGHEGLLCGTCSIGWTRPQFPAPCRTCSTMPPTGVLVLQILGDVSFQAFMSWFLAYSALIKTETQKNVMTVLLRLLMHWSTQVGVLSAFNLTKLHPLATADDETETEEEEEEEEVAVELPPNETDVPPQEGFAFPGFFSEVAGQMTAIGAVLNGLGSTQEVIECLIDRRFQGDGDVELTEEEVLQLKRWKLVGPALWWLSYPCLNVIWVMFLASIICFLVVPIANYFSKKPPNPKKKRKKMRRKQALLEHRRKMAREKRLEQEMDEKKSKTVKLSQLLADEGEVEVGKKVSKDAIDNFSDDSSSASSSDSNEGDKADDIEKYLLYTPEFLALCDEMVASVANPCRFSYEYVAKSNSKDKDNDEEKQTKVVEYYFQLFRKQPVYSREFVVDIAPWIIILLNNVWNVITGRMLQLLYCEKFFWSGTSVPDDEYVAVQGDFLMMAPDVKCYTTESDHFLLAMIACAGLSVWSFGTLLGYYVYINRRDLQSRLVTRNFGYMLEGYEPQFWYWELTIKKVDLLVTSLITYTNLAPEPRAKILLYSVQSAIAFAVQLSTGPYDNRQLRLLDNMENLGLLVRQLIFTGLSFSLLFGGGRGPIMILAVVLVVFVLYFFTHLIVHAADDYLSTQVAITKELFVHDHIDAQRKALKKMKKAGIPIDPEHLPEVDGYNMAHQTKFKALILVQNFFPFRGGNSENGYRHAQLLRCMWNGPGTDAVLYVPDVFEGWPYGRGFWRHMELWGIKMFNGLTASHMQDAFAEHMGSFVALLLSLANFNQFPARFTDMVFFLARATKRLKTDMELHPNTVRPAQKHADGEWGKPLQFKDREWLKVGMLEELFSSMVEEGSDKRNLLERVRKGVKDVLKREKVPLEAAWDVLDRLTNDQLRRAVLSPVALFARVGFFLILSASTERSVETVAHYTMMHHEEKKARKKMYRYVQFALRTQIEENAELDMDWTYIHQVLEALPVVELKRLLKDPVEIVDVAKAHHYLLHDEQDEDFKSSSSVMTVEDINSMLMFLQKLQYDELHRMIEYTQMLLDFLSLPAKADWRDAIIARGRRMGKAPDYYRRSRQQRIKMRESIALDNARKDEEDKQKQDEDNDIVPDESLAGPAVPQAPAMGSFSKDAPVSVDAPVSGAAVVQAQRPPDTVESKLQKFYNSDMAISSKLDDEEVGNPGGILCDMDELQPDDNMSVSSLGSLDDAIRWSQDDEEDDGHKDALWKKIEGLRKKAGTVPFYNITGRGSKASGASPKASDRGSRASTQAKSASQYSSIPSTLSDASNISTVSPPNSERLMEDLMRRSARKSPRRASDDPEETHV